MDSSKVNSQSVNDLYWQREELNPKPVNKNSDALTQADFFSLLTTQLAAQDPTKPTDNDKMISQMTNFTMAEGIGDLNTKFEGFTSQFGSVLETLSSNQTSNKALQASSMVGQTVLVPSDTAPLFSVDAENKVMSGEVMFEGGMNDIKLDIKDQSGKLIQTLDLGASTDGSVQFRWNGLNKNGEPVAADVYQISAKGINPNTGLATNLNVGAHSIVNSVRFGQGNELTMNLAGIGSYSMQDIVEVAP